MSDGVWTREDSAPKTQEIVDPADRFIRWRAPKVANIASVKVGDIVTEGECIEEFRQAVERFRQKEGLTVEQMGEVFTITRDTLADKMDEQAEKKANDEDKEGSK